MLRKIKRRCLRRGSTSLEVVLVTTTMVALGMAGFGIARNLYMTLYWFVASWIGSPYF